VKAIEKLRSVPVERDGSEIFINAIDMDVLEGNGTVVFKTPGDPHKLIASVVGQPAVFISEPLALKHHLKVGDKISLPVHSGTALFPIKAVYYDYSNDRGAVMMDRSVYAKWTRDDRVNGAALYLKTGTSSEQARQALLKRLPEGAQVFVQSTAQLRDGALRVFDQTFAITYGMEAIALLLAVMGIITTLTALILERRGEIVILRYVGATRRQVIRMILWEAGWIGLLGNLMGFGGGLVLAMLLIQVINVQSFGWTIQWHMPWDFLSWALGLVFVATLAAGFFPARLAGNLPAMREVTKE
jgi:putative ABC transport system permease protein